MLLFSEEFRTFLIPTWTVAAVSSHSYQTTNYSWWKNLCSSSSALMISISWDDQGCTLWPACFSSQFCLLSLHPVRSRSLLIYEEPHQLEESSSPISSADRNDRHADATKYAALALEAVPVMQRDDIMEFTIANETRLEKSVLLGLQQHRWVRGGLLVSETGVWSLWHGGQQWDCAILGTVQLEVTVWPLSEGLIGKDTVTLFWRSGCNNTLVTKLLNSVLAPISLLVLPPPLL